MSIILGRIVDHRNFEAQCDNCLHPIGLIPLTELTPFLDWLARRDEYILCFECDQFPPDSIPHHLEGKYAAVKDHENGPIWIFVDGHADQGSCLSSST